MITKIDAATPGESLPVEADNLQLAAPADGNLRVRRLLRRLGAAALLVGVAFSQANPLQIIPLAQGTDTEHNVILHMKGATDVLQADLVFPPGATAGWHFHPGPVVVVIKSGKLTEIHSDGCTTVHDTGSAFFENPGEVHNVSIKLPRLRKSTRRFCRLPAPSRSSPWPTLATSATIEDAS